MSSIFDRFAIGDDDHGDNPASLPLGAFAIAAIARQVVEYLDRDEDSPEFSLLLETLRQVGGEEGDWLSPLEAKLNGSAPEEEPLLALRHELALSGIELLAVALSAAVEEDLLLGRALARLQAPVGGSRPTLGLLAAALAPAGPADGRPIHALIDGNAVRSGLLALHADGAPLPERSTAVPPHLVLALGGRDGTMAGARIGENEADDVPLPPSVLEEAGNRARGLTGASGRALVIRTGSPAEGRAAAAAIAHKLSLRPLFVESTSMIDGLTPWLLLRNLLPVYCVDPGPGERITVPLPPLYRGPALAIAGPDGSVAISGATMPDWTIPIPEWNEREELWLKAIGDPGLARSMAQHHRHGAGRIAHLGRLAHQESASQASPGKPQSGDLATAAWTGEGGGLDGLAQPVPDPIEDAALVLPPPLRRELELLLLRCRGRDRLSAGLGASMLARYHPGVRALFVGPSGSGKTMAAGWLATRLGLPLYRVDLASVTSKYIGETEKNLARLLARAEQAEVVLLFDEADALFGKRTDIKEANDRFANAQTNYLLQRIETFDGITILTSNSRNRFDAAFSRRLDMIVDFPLPGPEERRRLWLSHLGDAHRLTPAELNRVAALVDLGGGHIRNAVLAAALLAYGEAGAAPVAFADVVQGLEGEYRKLGRQLPAELRPASLSVNGKEDR